jgi:ATP-dependent RNA helicase SUPV3L1/SUV3
MKARTGTYCGPLRLLAWEVSEKLRLEGNFMSSLTSTRFLIIRVYHYKGIKCSLVTGNERDEFPANEETHVASTIEMLNIQSPSRHYDVAVIDEAQLIGDSNRGWAWTQAVLGLVCPEIHLCGSATMLPIMKKIVNLTGDELMVKKYERLSPLNVVQKPLGGTHKYSFD